MSTKLLISLVFASLFNGIFCSPPLQLEPVLGLRHHEQLSANTSSELYRSSTRARLPAALIPEHYDVFLTPILDPNDPDFLKAPGSVSIKLQCLESTSVITLHSVEIEIGNGSVTVLDSLGNKLPLDSLSFDTELETFTISLSSPLIVGQTYFVGIHFVARVATDRTDGLYLSTYNDTQTGITNYHAATQFEAIGARKAFPCFDEPALKATFAFALGRKEIGFHTLWNTELQETLPMSDRPGYVWDVYYTTPVKMSTYILAIVVSDFESTTASAELYNKPVRVWGPVPLMRSSDRGAFAAETAAKVLKFYEQYLDHAYDFPKMDSVAVPVFGAGAMENWGLNLYRTYYLLLTDGESTVLDKWRIVSVICHEIAHQWWGNLVTLKWWNDIWLNEGFANYMQFIAASGTVPEFESMERVNIETTHSALEFDAGPNSVPVHNLDVENVVLDPGQIIAEKGAALIRMMNAFLTKDTLLQGLRNYLKGMAYQSAEQDNLFEFLDTQAHADGTLAPEMTVKQIMDTWTLQSGFPLIRVSKVVNSNISVTQEKFVTDPEFHRQQDSTWYVPIGYTTKSQPELSDGSLAPKFWLENNPTGTEFTAEDINDWFLVNPNAQCYYRVLYDEYFTTKLQEQLITNHTMIPSLSRAQLIDDYFKSSSAQYISIQTAMDFTVFLNKELSLPVWTTAFNNLRKILPVITDSSYQIDFYQYLNNLITDPLLAIGAEPVPDESPVTVLLRTQLMDWACALDNPQCISTASKLIMAWMTDPDVNPIATDLQPMLYCSALAQGDNQEVWDFLVAKYTASESSRQQTLLLNALACTKNLAALGELVQLAGSNSSYIRSSHSVALLQRIAMNQNGRMLLLKYIQFNVEPILANPRLSEAAIKTIVSTLSNYFFSPEVQLEMVEFLADNYALFSDDLKNSIKAAIYNINANAKWITIHGPELAQFFDSQNQ